VGAAASSDEAVLRVGSQSLSIGSLEQRLATLSALGLQPFGTDRASRLRGYLEQVVIPEMLLDEAAQASDLVRSVQLRDARDQLLGQALEHELGLAARPDDAEIQRYFDEHRSQFARPASILLWRILVDDAEQARAIIKECQGAKGVVRWRELSRERSLDKATHLRDGSLGFVRSDGTTEVPQLQVDKALYDAASKLADGEIVKEPVTEGNRFAVLWRRGSRPAQTTTLAEAAPSIRASLARERTRGALAQLLDSSRQTQLKQFHPEHIELGSYTLPTFTPRDAFPPAPAASGALNPPKATERGLR
jgi:peptidyl-prolyl cis-trans isomerase C